MAMIKCPECGKEVSSAAPSCPNCGMPLSEKKIPIHFQRKKTFSGSANSGNIRIDGVVCGSACNGTDFETMITVGKHTLQIEAELHGFRSTGFADNKTIDIPTNAKRVEVQIAVKSSFSSFILGCMEVVFEDIQIIT